ncbi:MAG TPA: hypothetical protein VGE97_03845, partial [Nitrososphaera sp.]
MSPQINKTAQIQWGPISLKLEKGGQIQIDTEKGSYFVESSYSYPGPTAMGWNMLAGITTGSEVEWIPIVNRTSAKSIKARAHGKFYQLIRRVQIFKHLIQFEDRLTNLLNEPIGLVVQHNITTPLPFKEAFTPNGAENPTIFIATDKDSIGVAIQDNISRLRFEPIVGKSPDQAKFRFSNFALDDHDSYTMRWAIYVLDSDTDYFDFINKLRKNWKTNFTIQGPFIFWYNIEALLNDPEQFRHYLERKRSKLVALSSFLDFDPGEFDHVLTWDEYKQVMQRAMISLKKLDPEIKCLGCIETDWVTIYPEQIPNGDQLPAAAPNVPFITKLSKDQSDIIDNANLTWKDSVKRNEDGTLTLGLYMRGNPAKPQTALSVYPAVGNSQYKHMLSQVRFLLDDVGMDGLYIDEFSQAHSWTSSTAGSWLRGVPTFPLTDADGWDKRSVIVDRLTGNISRKYIDCSLVGIQARIGILEYALGKGKIVVANTYSTSNEEQALPVNRFAETFNLFDPFAGHSVGEAPPIAEIFRGNLASPIGLGISGMPQLADTATRLMKAVMTYLRHGSVYYHYAIEDIPEVGPGSGEYGPINHMFP